jgi:hypothetical protein
MIRPNWSRPGACLAAAALLSGCLDFETVTRPVDQLRPAEIAVSAGLDDRGAPGPSGSSTAWLTAVIAPGTDARGERTMADDTLWVRQRPLVPEVVHRDGSRFYRVEWQYERGAAVPIEVPRIGRVVGLPLLLHWHPAQRTGPDPVRLRRGDDLVLRVSSPSVGASTTQDSVAVSWWLWTRGGAGATEIMRLGAVPDSVVLPASTLPLGAGEGTDRLDVVLRVQQEHRIHASGSDLRLIAHFISSVSWVVEVAPAADAP